MLPSRIVSSAVLTLCLAGTPRMIVAAAHRAKPVVGQDPETRVLVGPLGYRPPGQFYLLSGRTFGSLHFIDSHHLLFTFREAGLLHREESSGGSDNGQMIRAEVISLPGGEVVASTEWRMPDRSHYLWPLGGGKFLVRFGNAYLVTDASLALRPYIKVPTQILETEVSPDGRTLVIEHAYEKHTAEQHSRLEEEAAKYGEPSPAEGTQLTLVDIGSSTVITSFKADLPIKVPVTSNGYIGVQRNEEDDFVIRFMPFHGDPVILGKVTSTCTPHENFLNQKALEIESCGPKSDEVLLDVWTIEGKKLWSGRRDGRLVLPTYASATTGDRFAQGLLQVAHTINLADSLNDEDVRAQLVQVFDTATGTLLMSTDASPILAVGDNFALSADGEHLAVLRGGALEIYRVPSTTEVAQGASPEAKKK